MKNPATIDPRHSEFTVELIRKCEEHWDRTCEIRIRDGRIIPVVYIERRYISHDDLYDISHFKTPDNGEHLNYTWALNGFNTFPGEHRLDIMEIIEDSEKFDKN